MRRWARQVGASKPFSLQPASCPLRTREAHLLATAAGVMDFFDGDPFILSRRRLSELLHGDGELGQGARRVPVHGVGGGRGVFLPDRMRAGRGGFKVGRGGQRSAAPAGVVPTYAVGGRAGWASLHEAAEEGDLAGIERMINQGVDVNEDDEVRPAHASKAPSLPLSSLLSTNSQRGMTPLHYAARKNQRNCAGRLIDAGADIEAEDVNERRPLLHACSFWHLECAELLISKRADVNARDVNGRTALHLAISSNSARMDPSSLARQLACVALLLERGADIEAQDAVGEHPLSYACSLGKLRCAKELISRGAAVNAVDQLGRTALHWTIQNAAPPENGAPPDLPGSVEGLFACVTLLLDHGAAVGAKTKKGETALHWAALTGRKEFVQLLLERGADIEARNGEAATPLHIAAHYGRLQCAALLLERGANVQAVMGNGTKFVRASAISLNLMAPNSPLLPFFTGRPDGAQHG